MFTFKKQNFLRAAFAVAVIAGFSSCEDEESTPSTSGNETYTITVLDDGSKEILGQVNEDITMDAATNWILGGGVWVMDGATLTIEAGTTIEAADNELTPYLSVQRGGKLMAEGTSSAPIVFTSSKASPAAGDWGGIIVNGYADINTGETAVGEGDTGIYGGSNDSDNSGVIRYVRVEYAGKILGTNNELNGFSFNGVGSGTTVEYIQAYNGADDGIEFFGGTVSVRYAVSTKNSDDSFDWTHGWRGNGQFWVVNQGTESGDRGIEADNNGDDNLATPISNPTLSNITLIGANDGDNENTGMRLREGTKGQIYNAIVKGFPFHGVRVSTDASIANMDDNSLVLQNSINDGNAEGPGYMDEGVQKDPSKWKSCDKFKDDATNATDSNPSLSGYVGTVSENAKNTSELGSWFTAANYIGAVQSGNDWTAGWTKQ